MTKKIVIIGAGYSGTLTAKKLAKQLDKQDVEITLINKNSFHTMLTELHEVAAGRIEESGIRLELNKIFQGRKVKVVLDTVEEVDFKNQKITGQKQSYSYDYLVLAAGSRPNYYGISGASEFSYSLWSYEAAVRLNERIREVFHRAQSLTDEISRKKLLSFWVIGAGFSGVEMISELAEYIPVLCDKYGVSEDDVTLCNVDGLSRVIPNLNEKLSAKAEKKLVNKGIRVILNTKVDSMGEDFICLKTGEEVQKFEAGTIIWTAGTQGEAIVKQADDKLDCCRGRIQVDEYLRSVSDKKVYVVGDNMFYVAPGEANAVPQMVENCEQSAHTAAVNLSTEIIGSGKMHPYKPVFHGVMVSIGSGDGVASIALKGHNLSLSGFFAIAAKHFINVIYFIQVLGWNKVYQYLADEIFGIRNCRSLVGGHFSNRTPNFLSVPLRIWIGIVWLMTGLNGTDTFFYSVHNQVYHAITIIIGLMLIGGLFTTLAAWTSFVLQIIFMVMTKADIGNAWMMISTFAILFGAGKVMALDYYVMPYLNKWWKKLPFISKWYLYQD